MSLEYLDNGNPEGCIARGYHVPVIQGEGATRTLLASESGSMVVFDRVAGTIFTLPAPVVGMNFDFRVAADLTSNDYKVITDAGTTFMLGSMMMGDPSIATSGDVFEADGANDVAVFMTSAVTGDDIGGRFTLTAISTTVWMVEGILIGTGTMISPFTTS